jgi:hypothetical protein
VVAVQQQGGTQQQQQGGTQQQGGAQQQQGGTQQQSGTPPDATHNGLAFYRVQVMALHNALSNPKSYFANVNRLNGIITDMGDGFTKYMVGKFSDYKSAHDRREEVKAKGVVAPFVVAYNGSTRITVQEALMITKQQWIQ